MLRLVAAAADGGGGGPGLPWWAWVVVGLAIVLVLAVSAWFSWTAGRLDRMHLRVEAAYGSLLAQLQHRASVAAELAAGGLTDPASALLLLDAARGARDAPAAAKWMAESDLTTALHAVQLPAAEDEPLMPVLVDAARKVALGRRIYNDLVAVAVALHERRRVRWFHLAGHADAPTMVEFDDRVDFP
ncbi:MAG: hypothetical protein ACRDQA_01510 [Nocardioidaceae bacterium]